MGGGRIEAEEYRTGSAGMKTEAHGGPRQLENLQIEKKGNSARQHELQDTQTMRTEIGLAPTSARERASTEQAKTRLLSTTAHCTGRKPNLA
jgi:hypothetical protein